MKQMFYLFVYSFFFRMQDVIYRLSKVGIVLHLFWKIWN